MSRQLALPLALSLALPFGCAVEDDLDIESVRPEVIGLFGAGTELEPRPARQLIDAQGEVVFAPGGPPTIVYMNRNGGTFTPGTNDARNNRSTIPNQTSVISPWNVSDAGWNETMAHMREIWAPYNVTITDVDPGAAVPHFESVMAGYPGNVGMPNGVLGVSPYTLDCGLINNSIAYTFADYAVQVLGNDYREIAEIASQEVAHSFGLDHQLLASDPMTYLSYAGNRSFQDANTNCGEDSPRPCGLDAGNPCTNLGVAGSTTQQNSHVALLQRIGPVGELTPPDIAITAPQNGATVDPGFVVQTDVAGVNGATITEVSLYIDDVLIQTVTTSPFVFNAPADLAAGQHVVLTRATDSNGSTSDATITVTVPGEPGDPGDPSDPGDPGDPGDPSDPGNPGTPPSNVGGDLTGGCAVGDARSSSGLALSLLLVGLALIRRRRA